MNTNFLSFVGQEYDDNAIVGLTHSALKPLFSLKKSRANASPFGSKSLFLDRYGAHFATIQANFVSHQYGHLGYNLSPDAESLLPTNAFDVSIPQFAVKYAGADSVSTLNLAGAFKRIAKQTDRASIWQVVSGLRYGRKIESNSRSYTLPFRNRATGFVKTGRKFQNLSLRLRYGAQVRAAMSIFYGSGFKFGTGRGLYIDQPFNLAYGLSRFTLFSNNGAVGETAGAFLSRRLTNNVGSLFDRTQREIGALSAVSGVNNLRTVWFATNRFLSARFSQTNLIGSATYSRNVPPNYASTPNTDTCKIIKLMVNTGLATSRVSGDMLRRGVDSDMYAHFRERKQMRHANHRIVVGRAERKLWNYKKTRQYWRFMRWVSHFFFKGLCYLRFFTLRIDVFLVNHLRVRNMAMSRLFVRGGHAFIGDRACSNPAQFVGKYDIVSLSREVVRWMNYRSEPRMVSNSLRTPWTSKLAKPIRFARPVSSGGILHGRGGTFAILHGNFLDLVNAEPRRTSNSWSSFNYFQGQRVVASAWW